MLLSPRSLLVYSASISQDADYILEEINTRVMKTETWSVSILIYFNNFPQKLLEYD
jgi:hypothetical protein